MKSVLVVDDDPALRFVLTELIETFGNTEVLSAASFAEVQQLGKQALSTDVILLDINLGPDQPSGIDIYHWLVGQRYSGKIAFFTGHARTHPLIQAAIRLPDVELLEKPVEISKLQQVLEAHPQSPPSRSRIQA